MGKRHLYQSKHPFDVYAFEAFREGSWQLVEVVRIEDGTMTLHFDDEGTLSVKKGPFPGLRIRSRRAALSDCTCFLRPGIDINALSTSKPIDGYREEDRCPVWLDAKVNSIERKPHEFSCNCQFFVNFYSIDEALSSETKTLNKEISVLRLDQISILQKLERFPSEKEHFRWKNSSDCSLLHRTKLLLGKFLSDMSYLITFSTLQRVAFDIRSIEGKIVYKMIWGGNPDSKEINAMNLKLEKDATVPSVAAFTPCEVAAENLEDGLLPFCDVMDLRRSKRRYVQPDRFFDEINLDLEEGLVRTEPLRLRNGEVSLVSVNNTSSTDGVQARTCKSKSNQRTANSLAIVPFLCEGEECEYVEGEFGEFSVNASHSVHGRKGSDGKGKKEWQRGKGLFRCEKNHGSRKKSSSSCGYNEIFKRYMKNIRSDVKKEDPDSIDQWKEFQSISFINARKYDKIKSEKKEEISEVDILWREMDLSIASTYLLEDDDKGSNVVEEASGIKEKLCEHEYELNEQIGILCKFCGFVSTEIRHVLPPMVQPFPIRTSEMETSDNNNRNNPKQPEEEEHRAREEGESFKFFSAECSELSLSIGGDNVWALIPHLKDKLQFHQKKAFEFLWRNITGSLYPSLMVKASKNKGGCVISHSPGAGKTFLIIAFLLSYLKLFPGKHPLVLAPKTALYTWLKEIAKWEFPFPVHRIHGCKSYKNDTMDPMIEKYLGGHKPRRDILHALDCLEKIRKWHSHPSILLMGYTSFLALTRDSDLAHRKYMGEVLRDSPGIVVLDEGHNPRSTKSRLRKALMKVKTEVRVLLSGTLFQNNFGEYFNTLSLARPVFMDEVLTNLDTNFKRKKKGLKQTRFAIENRARKLFIETIAAKIDSKEPDDRVEGLSMLRQMTTNFIDVYEGEGAVENLPGLQCYTLVIKPTQVQNEILLKIQDYMSKCTTFPLELELLTTLGSIHPWLIRTAACVNRFFDDEELKALENLKFDLGKGSKVKFVVCLVTRSVLKNEKVLIFCHNIAPMNLFIEIFEWVCGWQKNKEILILRGDQDLSERGRVMEVFEDPHGKSKILLASISACAEGISLTAASRVILLDTEWNPAKRRQAVARAFRCGQEKVVYVYQLLVSGVLEESKFGRTNYKEWVSRVIFSKDMAEDPSRWETETIEDELLREIVEGDCAKSFQIIKKNAKVSNAIFGEKSIWQH